MVKKERGAPGSQATGGAHFTAHVGRFRLFRLVGVRVCLLSGVTTMR